MPFLPQKGVFCQNGDDVVKAALWRLDDYCSLGNLTHKKVPNYFFGHNIFVHLAKTHRRAGAAVFGTLRPQDTKTG